MNRYISIMIALAMCAVSAIAEIERGLGNEEIVDCNGGDGWEATVCSARPDARSYYISIKDTTKVKLALKPGRTLHGWTGDGSPVTTKGRFEWRGFMVRDITVEVDRKRLGGSAYDKIHALVKSKSKCALTILCDEKRPWNARLVGAEFPDANKTFEEGEDGKIKEVKPSDK